MGHRRIQTTRPSDLSVRRATAQDHVALYRVYYRSVRGGTAAFYNDAQRAAWAPSPHPKYDKPDPNDTLLRWVAEVDGKIVGFMSLTPEGYLDHAFVLPEWMGRGVAQAVYDQLLEWTHRGDVTRLTVHASHLARRFFGKQGWQVDYPEIHAQNGQEFERFFMSLELEKQDEKTI